MREEVAQNMRDKLKDLKTVQDGFPQGSRGWEALDWAIKNLVIAHDAYVLNTYPMRVDKHWEPGL